MHRLCRGEVVCSPVANELVKPCVVGEDVSFCELPQQVLVARHRLREHAVQLFAPPRFFIRREAELNRDRPQGAVARQEKQGPRCVRLGHRAFVDPVHERQVSVVVIHLEELVICDCRLHTHAFQVRSEVVLGDGRDGVAVCGRIEGAPHWKLSHSLYDHRVESSEPLAGKLLIEVPSFLINCKT